LVRSHGLSLFLAAQIVLTLASAIMVWLVTVSGVLTCVAIRTSSWLH
jgi:hypothetical protein